MASILVIGAGTMGRGIAGLCALSGHETFVFDADPEAQRGVRGYVESAWGRAIDKGKLTTETAEKARHRLKVATRLKDAAAVDFAIEAVPEAIDLKQMVFAELDDLCPPRTILASNTSSLSITRIARSTGRRDRVIGIHFFNPVGAMPLVELVAGKETSAETESRSLALIESLGKQAVRVTDSPGFATSRLGVALGLEAMRMLEEGVANAADIDRAMELGYGHRMGPLKTSDLVGTRRPARDRRDARGRAAVRALPAAEDPADAGRRGKDGPEGVRGLLPVGRREGDRPRPARGGTGPQAEMNVERRGLNLGIVLVAVGGYLLLRRELSFRGPAPILLLIGVILLVFSSLRQWRGPNVGAGVLLGLGTAFAARDRFVAVMPHWALMLLGIGAGLLLGAALEAWAAVRRVRARSCPGSCSC
jgi:3-hydroxybutyryl-CoA dehydrogenase